ncbi:MAG: efflux RND transporter permease subunit [Alphaproteobacteria bacterium]|nr:efflux RND transporter permease subunit [Alphaproteobacteria bacterium]
MVLSDISIKRPVFATVVSLLLVTFGVISFLNLPLRELPAIDPPIVSVRTNYAGASAAIVESKITKLIEAQIAGIAGVRSITSTSRDGDSRITVEFELGRNIDAAAGDIRDRVGRIRQSLPTEADAPRIYKVESDARVIVWYNLASTVMNARQLTDYASRHIVDRLATVDGVARVRIGGEQRYAMRIWLNSTALTGHGITVGDVEKALREKNVELPAGRIESTKRDFTVRVRRAFRTTRDFATMIIRRGRNGEFIRLGQLARVEIGSEISRVDYRGNRQPRVGLGVVKQSTANTLEVARASWAEIQKIQKSLPAGTRIGRSFDSSIFIDSAIKEVYITLGIAIVLVLLVIYLFLGSVRAAIIPAVTVPVSIISCAMLLAALGFSINLLTLLAMVLAIGLVVDDAIVVLENAQRRVDMGEPPLLAAYRGTRQVGFAVIATTLVLVAVFMPLAFIGSAVGRLFTELAFAISGAVLFSSLVALTLCAMLCSKLLRPSSERSWLPRQTGRFFDWLTGLYRRSLAGVLHHPFFSIAAVLLAFAGVAALMRVLPTELAPRADRGAFFVIVKGPEGAGFDYTVRQMRKVEAAMMRQVEKGEAILVLARVPGSFGRTEEMHTGRGIVVMAPWGQRKHSTFQAMRELRRAFAKIPGVRAFPVMRHGYGRHGAGKAVSFVLQGTSYAQLARWRDIVVRAARANPNFIGVEADYRQTRPQVRIAVDRTRAAELGVSLAAIGRTLETMFGSRRVTTYVNRGEEYHVILQADRRSRLSKSKLFNLYVRSERTQELIPLSNLVRMTERAGAGSLARYNRLRAITIQANLAAGYSLGTALAFLERTVREEIPNPVGIGYKGQSADFQESKSSMAMMIGLALVIVFLVLAGQFESFIHPIVVMVAVPLAIVGGLLGLLAAGSSINIYSQIGLVILIGLAAKNGILIVEFANQLRDGGMEFEEALIEASATRFRPILMTALSTVMGAMPLVLSSGAGSESRFTIGIVIVAGLSLATALTLFVVPVFYNLLCRRTQTTGTIARRLSAYQNAGPETPAQAHRKAPQKA